MTDRPGNSFLAALRERRADFNGRFERARHQYPQLEADDVLVFLRTRVSPVIAAVEQVDRWAVESVLSAVYDATLVLCGQKLVAGGGRFPVIGEGWTRVLAAAAIHVARDPTKVTTAIANALHKLATTPGARPNDWIESVVSIVPRCADVQSFLRVGQVLAWRSGLAHLRESALATVAQLPAEIALLTVGAPAGEDWPTTLGRLEHDVWFDPGLANESAPVPRVVKETGAFRGLGGLFLLPPQIAATHGGWLVQSAGQHWFLAADVFGATFHRATADEWVAEAHELRLPDGVRVAGAELRYGTSTLAMPVAGPVTSIAASGSTIAVTSAHTHAVAFIALN
jgi:hypothetical protein